MEKCKGQIQLSDSMEILEVEPKLTYFAPSHKFPAEIYLPHYECNVTLGQQGQKVEVLRSLIPASDDPQWVPNVFLDASVGPDQTIEAKIKIDGGRPPYRIHWSSSTGFQSTDDTYIKFRPLPRKDLLSERLQQSLPMPMESVQKPL